MQDVWQLAVQPSTLTWQQLFQQQCVVFLGSRIKIFIWNLCTNRQSEPFGILVMGSLEAEGGKTSSQNRKHTFSRHSTRSHEGKNVKSSTRNLWLVLQYNHFSVIVCLSSRLDGRDAPVPVSLLVFSSSTPSCHQFPTSALLETRLGWGENDSDDNSVAAAFFFLDLWHQIAAPSEIVAVKIGLEAGRGWGWNMVCTVPHLCVECHCATTAILCTNYFFLAAFFRPTECFYFSAEWYNFAAIFTAAGRLHGRPTRGFLLFLQICMVPVYYLLLAPWPHRVQSNSNQIKVNPYGPAVR